MRKIVLLGFLACVVNLAMGQKVRFGLAASPAITWAKALSNEVDKGKVRAGVDYGLIIDINLGQNQNYAISTGVNILLTGGNVTYRPGGPFDNAFPGQTLQPTFRKQYLRLPALFKLKTNQIGYITYFTSFGMIPSFRIQARVDATLDGAELYDNENLLRDNVTVFKSNFFQLALEVAGGIEYALNDRTALLLALVYQNAFINTVKDPDKEKILFNHVALRTGIMF